jgi:uncharacterized protein (DUF1778 family)
MTTKLKHGKDEMLSFRLSSRIMKRLRGAADREGQQVSDFVRLAILREIERKEVLLNG